MTDSTPHSGRDLRVPEITRCWEQAAKAMPQSDPADPDDPSVNLDTLAAIANAKWWKAHDLEEQFETLRETVAVAIQDVLLLDSPEGDSPRNIAANLREALASIPASRQDAQ